MTDRQFRDLVLIGAGIMVMIFVGLWLYDRSAASSAADAEEKDARTCRVARDNPELKLVREMNRDMCRARGVTW